MKTLTLNGHNLTIDDLYEFSTHSHTTHQVVLDKQALSEMQKSREYVQQIVESEKVTYGINTGFGALASKFINKSDLSQLQYNLIRSHCTGVGEPFDRATTRAIMILRANCLASGFSGVNPSIVQLIIDFLNHDILPVVPMRGSVGASGDLAPLSHIALALIGEGEVFLDGKIVRSDFAIQSIHKAPALLGPKDGLALINGTAVMNAIAAIAIYRAENLAKTADIAGCMTLEAVRGTNSAFDKRITELKPHPGQLSVVTNLAKLLQGSVLLNSHPDCGKVQDPYSLRCIPQVHGAARQTLRHAREVIETEINSVTDNPLIFYKDQTVISGGNFHGEALALCMDYLAMGLSELASIAERRVEKMMNPSFSDLPAFLTPDSGLNSGFMIAHVTMAALTSECKTLCHPASVDSIPTSTDKEDHVSMGINAGLKLNQIIKNVSHCLSIELLCAAQGLDFLLDQYATSPTLMAIHSHLRKHVEKLTVDRILYKDIEQVNSLVWRGEIVTQAEKICGKLQ
jgi:histidine ammonia-lyase